MNELILLGAGASVDAEVPAAYDMTKRLIDLFENNPLHSRILRFVIGGLLMKEGMAGRNPFNGVNVEDVFNAIQLLAKRESLEASPFIGSWHPMIDELDEASTTAWFNSTKSYTKQRAAQKIERAIQDMINGKSSHENIGSLIEEIASGKSHISTITSSWIDKNSLFEQTKTKSGNGRIFDETSHEMIQKLIQMVWIQNSSKVAYLSNLVDFVLSTKNSIATLNYDNTVELAAQSKGQLLNTGIDSWSKMDGFLSDTDGTYLLKLHGSIDWAFEEPTPTDERPLKQQVLQKMNPNEIKNKSYNPAVIFGQKNKLTARGPFLDLLRVFREKLSRAIKLTVIGYSFRDDHINEYIGHWFNHSSDRKIRIINGPQFELSENVFTKQLVGCHKRVEVLRVGAAEGIAQCYPSSQTA